MKIWWRILVVVVGVIGLMGAQGPTTSQTPGFGEVAAAAGVRFVPVDVVVDAGKDFLGAYQVEVVAPAGVTIAGLEGGESVFGEAPYYDPAALVGGRVVVAAFSTAAGLPSGKVRVARLHLMVGAGVEDAGLEKMGTKLVVATDGQGRAIAATMSLRVFRNEGDKR